ncbi:hypothetical protein KLEP7_gp63 [Pseudaeromonas phage vB_PpeM_ KLEP7]|nr:hypothetical protein KLEP7_gp63 [Pseudaeromonas phage vB_PpeM_ KLEP7]
MKEFISLYISNIYELSFVVLWLTYGLAFGFKNWVLRLVVFLHTRRYNQSQIGKVLDMLFLVSMIVFVMFKQDYFNL